MEFLQMTQEELKKLKINISNLSINEEKMRNLHLRKVSLGLVKEKMTGYASIDKPWLKYYSEDEILADVADSSAYDYLLDCMNKGGYASKIATNFYGTMTYQQMFNKADKLANVLYENGIKKGDKVSLCLPSLPETFVLFLALNKIGAIANFIDPRINSLRIKECIGEDTKLLISIDKFNDKIGKVADELGIENRVELSPADSLPLPLKVLYNAKKTKYEESKKFVKWNKFISKKASTHEFPKNSSNDIAAIVYTSGTTGVPKGAKLTNKGLNAICLEMKQVLKDYEIGDKMLGVMPPFLAYGLACGICCPLSSGMECHLVPDFKLENFSKMILKIKPNLVIGVPNFYETLIKEGKVTGDLSYIKYFIAGGDKMTVKSKELVNDFIEKHNIKNKVVEGWGMTENHSVMAVSVANGDKKLSSTGLPLSKNNIMIVGKDGNEVKYGEEGEIFITGPSVMAGYSNNDSENKKIFMYENGIKWIKTGDIGKIDKDGSIFITGRKKRMLTRPDGHNVFPGTIEDVILKHPAVDSCVVIGTINTEGSNGTIPTAIIVLKQGYDREKTIGEINDLSLKLLPPRDIALRYYVVDQIPMNNVGKIDYRLLENTYNNMLMEEQEKTAVR